MRAMVAFASAALFAVAAPVYAQGWIEPDRPVLNGGVVKLRTEVSVRVTGRIARVEVEEWFQNRGGGLAEGVYLYPMSGEAVFSNFSLFQGEDELRGETMDAERARAIYEEIVRRKRDPALIELVGHGLVRARVFPIAAGETRKITLRYTQLMSRAGDALAFRYAAGGAPQMTRRPVEGNPGPTPQREAAPLTFLLTADSAAAFADPFSPTHAVDVTRRSGRLTVRPRGALEGDFALFLPLTRTTVGLTLATHRLGNEHGYFMLTLSPAAARAAGAPRDLTVVVDVSGSMSGQKIEQARAALHQLLGTLGQADRFRLISFSSAVRPQQGDWARATPTALRAARAWVDALRADGGTNIAGALTEAFRLPSHDDRLPIVLFLTDGLPSVGERNPERIAAQAERDRGRARVFAFGIGYDVNTYLLDRLSAAGRGATAYVEPHEDVERTVGGLVAKIQHPVLTDLALDASVRLREIYPERLPDLFAGEELVVFGRYETTAAAARVTLAGRRDGRTERYQRTVGFPDHAPGNDFIPRLWAARKLGALQQAVRLNGNDPELVEEIKRTALRYGLLSEYTAYLVQEPEMVADARGRGQRRAFEAPAAAPARASGVGAVMSAKADRARREVKSAAELDAADEVMLQRGHMGQAQHVAGRVFTDRDGVWTDVRHGDSLPVVTVEPFSPAYFELLRQLPELSPYVQRFERVLVAGHAVSVRIAPGGTADPQDLRRVVGRFRTP
ncbi:MAG: VIT and VWA domain-containing protein [Gemmatimonadota bacterium]|nr:VIT and VWA domain-containing protein [Gemmatimonadota bacterium]